MITTGRNKFLGFHTTEEVREQIERQTIKQGQSMSEFIHTAVVEKLERAQQASISDAEATAAA